MAEIIKLTNIEKLIEEYEQRKALSKQALEKFSVENQLRGYLKLLDEIEEEKARLRRLEEHADLIDLKNPIRVKKEVAEVRVRLLELEKAVYDRLKDFRTSEEENVFVPSINIAFINTSPKTLEEE